MVRDADHARAEHDTARTSGGGSDENVRRRNDFPSRGMVFADEDLVVAGAVEPFDEFEVALETKGGVFAGAMERRHENAEFHPVLLNRSLGARLALSPSGSPKRPPRHLTTVPIAATIAETGSAQIRLIS